MSINDSFVNTIRRFVKKKQLKFKHIEFFNYRKLMTNPEYNYRDLNLLSKYDELSMNYHNRINVEDDDGHDDNIPYVISTVKSELMSFGYSDIDVADMLTKYLYSADTEAKMLLWACFGSILLKNLKRHVNPRETYCKKCGRRFIPRANAHRYCDSCFIEKVRKPDERIITCQTCGKDFLVPNSVRNKKRCDYCQEQAKKELTRLRVAKFRAKNDNITYL